MNSQVSRSKLLLLGLSLFVSGGLYASEGNEGARGGDGVLSPHQGPALADGFLVNARRGPIELQGESFNPSDAVKKEISALLSVAKNYGPFDGDYGSLRAMIQDEQVQYFYVETLKDPRCDNQAQYQLPENWKPLGAIGCSWRNKTWIKKGVYEQMPVREQALLLIHERMRGRVVAAELSYVADVTTGLRALREAAERQKAGDLNPLTAREIEKIQRMIVAAPVAISGEENDLLSRFSLTVYGGLIVATNAVVAPSAFIGAGARVGYGTTIEEGALVIDSDLYGALTVGSRVRITGSDVICDGRIESGAKVESAKLDTGLCSVGKNVVLQGVEISGKAYELPLEKTVDDRLLEKQDHQDGRQYVDGYFRIDAGSSLKDSKLVGALILVGKDAQATEAVIDSSSAGIIQLGEGARIQNASLDDGGGALIIRVNEGARIHDLSVKPAEDQKHMSLRETDYRDRDDLNKGGDKGDLLCGSSKWILRESLLHAETSLPKVGESLRSEDTGESRVHLMVFPGNACVGELRF